jgi:hypothetical protein
MIEAVSIPETSIDFYEIKERIIIEDRHYHIRRIENLKSEVVSRLLKIQTK